MKPGDIIQIKDNQVRGDLRLWNCSFDAPVARWHPSQLAMIITHEIFAAREPWDYDDIYEDKICVITSAGAIGWCVLENDRIARSNHFIVIS